MRNWKVNLALGGAWGERRTYFYACLLFFVRVWFGLPCRFWMLHEFADAARSPLVSLQPLHLPFCDSVALFRQIMARFWFVDPFKLPHEDNRLFCSFL